MKLVPAASMCGQSTNSISQQQSAKKADPTPATAGEEATMSASRKFLGAAVALLVAVVLSFGLAPEAFAKRTPKPKVRDYTFQCAPGVIGARVTVVVLRKGKSPEFRYTAFVGSQADGMQFSVDLPVNRKVQIFWSDGTPAAATQTVTADTTPVVIELPPKGTVTDPDDPPQPAATATVRIYFFDAPAVPGGTVQRVEFTPHFGPQPRRKVIVPVFDDGEGVFTTVNLVPGSWSFEYYDQYGSFGGGDGVYPVTYVEGVQDQRLWK